MTPLIGLPFISDQRIVMYEAYSRFGVNPLAIMRTSIHEIDYYISQGLFRPPGHFMRYFEQAAIFDIATATNLPPYVLQGAIRLVMIALLSYTAAYFISTLYRSARLEIQDLPASAAASNNATPPPPTKAYTNCTAPVEIFPFLFAACLIVTGPQHPISFFPFLSIFIAIAMLAIPLYIASHTALSRTRINAKEVVSTVLTGATVAAFHDIMFIMPLVCLVVLLMRGWIMGITARGILRTNAFLRYLTFSCGFLTVFIPARIAMSLRCNAEGCYDYANTEPALSGLAITQWIGRAFSGLPREAIGLILRGDLDAGLSPRGPRGLLSNTWTIIVIALTLLLAIRAGRHLIHKQAQLYASGTPRKDSTSTKTSTKPITTEQRVGTALIIIGLTLICFSSLLVSMTHGLQRWHEWEVGLEQWRDTLLVQIGWSLALFGALHLLFLASRKLMIVRVALIGIVVAPIGIALIFSSGLLVLRLLPSAMQGLRERYELGWGIRPFRDTLLARIGWALVLIAALYLLFLALRKFKVLRFLSSFANGSSYLLTDGIKHILIAGSAAVLFALTVFTFIANDRYAITGRYDPDIYDPNSRIDNLISMAVIDFDDTDRGQHTRCQLIDAYMEEVWSGYWPNSRQIQEALNRLTRSEYGAEFCPTPP